MRNRAILFTAILIAFCSCQRPPEKASTITATEACPAGFYYYNQEKVPLKIHAQIILVGFKTEVTREDQLKIMKQFPAFETMSPQQPSDGIPFNVVKLQPKTTCPETLETLKKLQEKSEVLFANPAYNAPRQVGADYLWLGLTAEILVTVKNPEQIPDLKRLVSDSGARVADALGETTLLIAADKNASKNALELANYFHEQSFVINAEPNFYLATKPVPKPAKTSK